MQATIADRNRIHGNIAGHLDKSGEGLDDVWINRMDESLRHKANATLRALQQRHDCGSCGSAAADRYGGRDRGIHLGEEAAQHEGALAGGEPW